MYKQRFSKTRIHRRTSLLSRGWQNLRFYWYTQDKAPLIFVRRTGTRCASAT